MFPLRDDNPTRRVPYVTVALLIANIAVFFLVQPRGGSDVVPIGSVRAEMPSELAFNLEYAAIPCELVQGRPLELEEVVSTFVEEDREACGDSGTPEAFPDKQVHLAVLFSMFLHGGLLHLGGNMLFLWIFGNNIEDHLGHVRYALFYVASGLAATAAHVLLAADSTVPIVGASGAIAGIMGAYLIWFPNASILTAFFFIFVWLRHIRAKWLLVFWFVSQFFVSPEAGVAWVAHVGGFLFGVIVAVFVRSSRAARRVMWTRDYTGPGQGPPGGGPSMRW